MEKINWILFICVFVVTQGFYWFGFSVGKFGRDRIKAISDAVWCCLLKCLQPDTVNMWESKTVPEYASFIIKSLSEVLDAFTK
jgi:hypothetical protein